MEREPELNDEYRALFERFLRSEECARASCGSARWLLSFLDTLATCEWTLEGLDIYGLNAALFDGMGWTIDSAPDDSAAVARELHAFLRWAVSAAGVESSPEYEECCAYLASSEAADDIARWLAPIEFSWQNGVSP